MQNTLLDRTGLRVSVASSGYRGCSKLGLGTGKLDAHSLSIGSGRQPA